MTIFKPASRIIAVLLVLTGPARAQESAPTQLDPQIPWFKVEIIVFRNLTTLPGDDEVFTPRPEPPGLQEDSVDAEGALDTRTLGIAQHERVIDGQESSLTDLPGNQGQPAALATSPDITDSGPAAAAPGAAADSLPSDPTPQDLHNPPESHFYLVDIESFFDNQNTGLEAAAPGSTEHTGVNNQNPSGLTTASTEQDAARQRQLHEFELQDQVRRIANSKRYQVVAHLAWIQPGYPEDQAVAFPLAQMAGPASGLKGDVTLYLSRFLHMQFNLSISDPDSQIPPTSEDSMGRLMSFATIGPEGGSEPPSPLYIINEKRRMRSGELQYLDHPKFGVLTRVTKVEPGILPKTSAQQTISQP